MAERQQRRPHAAGRTRTGHPAHLNRHILRDHLRIVQQAAIKLRHHLRRSPFLRAENRRSALFAG
ncbi:hypothetical protein D3C80_1819770 [compost metagenome]